MKCSKCGEKIYYNVDCKKCMKDLKDIDKEIKEVLK